MWLPILDDLRERLSHARFVFLVPSARQVGVLDIEDALFSEANRIFDTVVCPSITGRWQSFRTIEDARKSHDSEALVRIWRRVKRSGMLGGMQVLVSLALRVVSSKVVSREPSNKPSPLTELRRRNPVFLMNIFELSKPYMGDVGELCRNRPKFSMYHGVRLETQQGENREPEQEHHLRNTTALVFSEKEVDAYRQRFNLEKKDIRVIGIPRHQEKWLEHLESLNRVEIKKIPASYILVLSRPSGDDANFSRERKLRSLNNIRLVAEKHNLRVVIKLHPKEREDDGTAQEVFGIENKGTSWMFSRIHPIVLGNRCTFAVTFLSSLAVDFSRLGIPVIEHIDTTREIPPHDPRRDDQDDQVSSGFADLGFAISTNNRQDFELRAEEIINARGKYSARASHAYQANFPMIDNVIETVSNEIMSRAVGAQF